MREPLIHALASNTPVVVSVDTFSPTMARIAVHHMGSRDKLALFHRRLESAGYQTRELAAPAEPGAKVANVLLVPGATRQLTNDGVRAALRMPDFSLRASAGAGFSLPENGGGKAGGR